MGRIVHHKRNRHGTSARPVRRKGPLRWCRRPHHRAAAFGSISSNTTLPAGSDTCPWLTRRLWPL